MPGRTGLDWEPVHISGREEWRISLFCTLQV